MGTFLFMPLSLVSGLKRARFIQLWLPISLLPNFFPCYSSFCNLQAFITRITSILIFFYIFTLFALNQELDLSYETQGPYQVKLLWKNGHACTSLLCPNNFHPLPHNLNFKLLVKALNSALIFSAIKYIHRGPTQFSRKFPRTLNTHKNPMR